MPLRDTNTLAQKDLPSNLVFKLGNKFDVWFANPFRQTSYANVRYEQFWLSMRVLLRVLQSYRTCLLSPRYLNHRQNKHFAVPVKMNLVSKAFRQSIWMSFLPYPTFLFSTHRHFWIVLSSRWHSYLYNWFVCLISYYLLFIVQIICCTFFFCKWKINFILIDEYLDTLLSLLHSVLFQDFSGTFLIKLKTASIRYLASGSITLIYVFANILHLASGLFLIEYFIQLLIYIFKLRCVF